MTAAALSCTKLGDLKVWNNPNDPNGVNWHPPLVHAPRDTSVAINDSAAFFANGSDENGRVVGYEWSLDHGKTWPVSSADSVPVRFCWGLTQVGAHVIWVKDEDNDGLFSPPDSFTVTVHSYRPVVKHVNDTIVSQYATVAIHVVASDTNGAIAVYYWKTGQAAEWTDSSVNPDLTFSHPQGGALNVTWEAKDQRGLIAVDTFSLLFNRGPTAVTMLSPVSGDTALFVNYDYVNASGSTRLRFAAQDPDSTADVVTCRLFLGAQAASMALVYTGATGVYQADNLLPATNYSWKLVAKDLFGDSIVNSGGFFMQRAPGGPRGMVLIRCAGRSFPMGYPAGDSTERPVHQVLFSHNFWIDTGEVSEQDFDSLLNVSVLGRQVPVANVNWYDAVLYCNARSKRDNKDTVYRYASITGTPGNNCVLTGVQQTTASGYRLPTEAEWEYACRGGSASDYYWGDDRVDAPSYAWDIDNSNGSVQRTGLKKPNAFNLYDMAGNVWEWCYDWFSAAYYQVSPASDPQGPSDGTERVIRGGSWMHSDYFTGSGVRSKIMPAAANASIGFRAVLQNP
jgi:formylglycine-generating enzyme required for sulfatase activity